MSDLAALDFFNKLLAVLMAFSTFLLLCGNGRTGKMFHVITGRKLLKLIGIEWWTIVTHQLIGDCMP